MKKTNLFKFFSRITMFFEVVFFVLFLLQISGYGFINDKSWNFLEALAIWGLVFASGLLIFYILDCWCQKLKKKKEKRIFYSEKYSKDEQN